MKKKPTAGGFREGAGRPKGSGKYGEKTQPIRVPISLVTEVKNFIVKREDVYENVYELPLYSTRVAAGLPSPADDTVDRYLNLNEYLIESPTETFCVKAIGDSMINAGINENDILIVDRSLKPTHGKVIIAVLNNELTVKRLELKGQRTFACCLKTPVTHLSKSQIQWIFSF